MLSAARDIVELQQGAPVPHSNSSRYDCNQLSTGAVLLADVLPSLLMKLLAPLAPHWLSYDRLIGQRRLGAGGGDAGDLGFRLPHGRSMGLGLGHGRRGALGVAVGRGGAGGGAWPLRALLPAAALPMGTALSFFFLLLPPPPPPRPTEPPPPTAGVTWGERWGVVKGALPDAFPLAVVYLAEYFINQGVLDLLYFPTSSLTHNEQYRWAQLLYQVGVFASRSGLPLYLGPLWVLNAALLLAAVLAPFLPAVGVAFALVLWEGLVGGAAYGGAFLLVGQRAPPRGRGLAVAVTSLGQSLGVALAGVAAMGLHKGLCAP
ncbi:battenin-like [Pezoporus flaviventris]|uniref:battenin-like n=1 Tax=Pezoporus flaviventris TaxID=889875 RepID=UPI002AB064C5|nr:battenin-like [Pezoporus flaviventris]